MCVGERREIDVPPVLGFGPKGLPKRGVPGDLSPGVACGVKAVCHYNITQMMLEMRAEEKTAHLRAAAEGGVPEACREFRIELEKAIELLIPRKMLVTIIVVYLPNDFNDTRAIRIVLILQIGGLLGEVSTHAVALARPTRRCSPLRWKRCPTSTARRS